MKAKVSSAFSRDTSLLLLTESRSQPQKQHFYCLLSAFCHLSLASNIYFCLLISMANEHDGCIELAVVYMLLFVLDISSSLPVFHSEQTQYWQCQDFDQPFLLPQIYQRSIYCLHFYFPSRWYPRAVIRVMILIMARQQLHRAASSC